MISKDKQDKLAEAEKKMLAKMNKGKKPKKEKDEKPKKSYHKTVREENKELRESRKEKVVKEPENKDYEQFLIESLFKDSPKVVQEEVKEEVKETPKRERTGLWDYVLEDEIKFFDPECSYELTKFRPINETQGLDFDPAPFCEMARLYEETGKYTQYPEGSKPYADFWNEQIRRCKEGYEVNGYRITGDNYFFLNFYRMQTVIEGNTAGKGRNESFPSFLAKQYEFFHYVEMAEKLHKDVGILKARGL